MSLETPSSAPPSRLRWLAGRLFRRRNRGLGIVLTISLFLTFGGPGWVMKKLAERRCKDACSTYMSGRPGAQWVGEFADGAGYSALLQCMSASLYEQQGYDCWRERVHACTQACAADPKAVLD